MVEYTAPPVPASLRGHVSAWTSLTSGVLQHAASLPRTLGRALDEAPEAPALLAAKGIIMMLAGRRETVCEARAAERAAVRALERSRDPHDAAYVRALSLWLEGRPSEAADVFDALLERWPGDALALKFGQAIRFIYGDVGGMRASADAAIDAFADDHPHAGYVHGCRAFALEESFGYDAALEAGYRALALCDDDAWGLHAVAHVYEMTGAPEEGRALIAANRRAYEGCSTFRHHVDWHAALFELELGNTDAAMALYDGAVRFDRTDDYRDIANAVSLLARLAAEGVDVGERWEELADIAERRADDACITFADLHYLMALLAGGREEAAGRMLARLAGPSDGTEPGDIAAAAGGPASSGLAAFYRGRYRAALDSLLAAGEVMQRVGGSHAQRDVFARITIDAAVRAGRPDVARRLIAERASMRGRDRFARSRLSKCLRSVA
ncbi:tetratricopeptide repeat-containing protein [Acuticoccus sediminis]|uniref:Tetratricopeptide repeat protein 38 n=1 Tax=Acuticoccus sediminis TaxID=2184697 RepID=A0A8B2NJ87_9HYPH|nr:tetratricopeptide repeat-containing protein [Acuticoccus sediminis]